MKVKIGFYKFGFLVAGGCVLLMGCLRDDRNPSTGETSAGAAKVVIQAGRIGALAKSGPLAKAATIDLAELEVTLTAEGEPPLTETFPLSGNGPATVSHTFQGLASPKTWNLSALTRDRLGEVIHRGVSSFEVRPRQTARVDLALSALFSMLRANFHPIRDSVTRVELWVDDARRDDSAFAKQSALGDTIPLFFDYLAAGSSHILGLRVFGEMWGLDTLLYSADTSLDVVAGEDGAHSLLLRWVGPASPPPGQATMTVSLGRVGTQVVNGHLEDTGAGLPGCPSEWVLVPKEMMSMGPNGSGGAGLRADYSNGEVRLGEGPIWFGPHEAGWVASWYPADRLADDTAPALWRTISGIGGEILTGYIRGPRTGRVSLLAGSDDYSSIVIPGLISVIGDNTGSALGTAEMAAGAWYPITLEYRNRWGTNGFNFFYRCE